jgi:UDP-glucose 4-epimerase
MRSIGVTGGAGFIGGYVTKALRAAGYEVVTFDRWGHAPDGATAFLGDVRDEVAVTEFAAHVDGIIHLAAVLGTQETIANPRPAAHTNIIGTLNVFEAAAQYGLPLVNAAVGNARIGRGTYCITKTCAEDFVAMYNEDRGQRFVSVRPVNAYGPGQKAPAPLGSSKVRKIAPTFILSALTGQPIPLYGDGKQTSDMVHVRDVARSFVAALELAAGTAKIPARPVEVGPVESCTVAGVAMLVLKEIGSGSIQGLPMRPGEPPQSVVKADTSTLAAIGIDPKTFVNLTDGIAETVAYYRTTEGTSWRRSA